MAVYRLWLDHGVWYFSLGSDELPGRGGQFPNPQQRHDYINEKDTQQDETAGHGKVGKPEPFLIGAFFCVGGHTG
jgi:hypothetical protein